MEVEKVNFEELEKQRKENILKGGKYCGVEILVGKGENQPISYVHIQKVSPYEVALLIIALKESAKSLEKKFPLASEVAKHLGVDTYEIDE